MGYSVRQQTIGIIGGASDVATAEYYKHLNAAQNAHFGGWTIAETLIAGLDFGMIEACVRAGEWAALETYIESAMVRLQRGGADFVICVSHTLHKVALPASEAVGLPLLHIVDPAAEAIRVAGLTKVALFGTKPVMATDYVRDRYKAQGVETVVPTEEEQVEIDRIIFDELCRFSFTEKSRARYVEIVHRLAQEEGAQGLIMGCTEIPLLLHPGDCGDLPLFDTCRLHAEAAAARARA